MYFRIQIKKHSLKLPVLEKSYVITIADAHNKIGVRTKARVATYGNSTVKELNITVNDTRPTTPTLTTNSTIHVGNELKATGSGSTDADNDTITYYYSIYNYDDGTIRKAWSTKQTYTINTTDAEDKLGIRVKARVPTYQNSTVKETNVTVTDINTTFNNAKNWSNGFQRYKNFTANITVTDADGIYNIIYSTNASGTWTNYSRRKSGITNTSPYSKNITQIKGKRVSWRYYANDSSGTITASTTYYFIVNNTPPTTPTTDAIS